MLEHCIACSRGRHDACDGIDYVIDQDGHSRYMCGCSCNRKTVTRPCPTCKGSGEVAETSYTKNRGRAATGGEAS